ncbi:expressed unknown protein [Seminavis robusta]|uniref:Selenoprotein H n=1 Tax=Seminavis robusta TaxID=568900 RepID=A0A9N8H2D1_9STRA|nr:expressed unknown protein [Seminavis robusta]|eukprot:Sro17_g012130.1 n/a (118) ;mRNA; f:38119-38595
MARVTRSSAKKDDKAPAKAEKTEAAAKAAPKKKKAAAKKESPAKKEAKSESDVIEKAVGKKATVKINEEKPGKGNFVVRISGKEEPVVELLGMKRPFPPLKQLDMDEVCEKVLAALA